MGKVALVACWRRWRLSSWNLPPICEALPLACLTYGNLWGSIFHSRESVCPISLCLRLPGQVVDCAYISAWCYYPRGVRKAHLTHRCRVTFPAGIKSMCSRLPSHHDCLFNIKWVLHNSGSEIKKCEALFCVFHVRECLDGTTRDISHRGVS